jgi:2-(1,2-epoxy-1,2-dihydrophenyl)acetyl-CoA isomerase
MAPAGVPGDPAGDVRVEVHDDFVASVVIVRPPDNYFDSALIAALADAYERLDADPRCRAIVLRSEGRHFCAGAQFGGPPPPAGPGPPTDEAPQRHLYDEAIRMFAASTPVVAAVRGAAIGGGLGLALSADFRIGAPESRLSANFARLGFHHGFALTVTLPAVVGQQHANRMLLTGERLGGTAAADIGLLDRLVAHEDVDAAAHDLAAEIAASAPLAARSIRTTMRLGLLDRIRDATRRERSEQERLMVTADFAEGIAASRDRRPPRFEGR